MLKYALRGKNSKNFVNKNKAQSSTEFLLIFIFLITALLVISFVSLQKSNLILSSQKHYEAGNFLKGVTDKINTVFIEGDGFSMSMALSESILGYDYSFELEGNNLRLSVFEMTYERLLITEDVVGIDNLNLEGTRLIQNSGGTVIINE